MKILIGILLGMFLHKSITGYYSYVWWTAESQCRDDIRNKEDPFICIYEKVGKVKYINYMALAPAYTWQKWELRN